MNLTNEEWLKELQVSRKVIRLCKLDRLRKTKENGMVKREEEVTTIRIVEETIKKVVYQIKYILLTKAITDEEVQIEEWEIEEKLIKVIFSATIVKSMAIMQVYIEEARKIKKLMQSLHKTE